MPFLVISAAVLALLVTILCFSRTIQKETVKKQQLNWINGETKYLDEELEKSFFQRYISPAFRKVQNNLNKMPKNNRKIPAKNARMENELRLAGLRMTSAEFMFFRIIGTFGILFLGIAFILIAELDVQIKFLVFLGLLFAIVLIPRYYLKSRIKTRQMEIQNQMPNVMDVLCVCIEAGLSFDSALLKVNERFKGPLIEELSQVYREIQMGIPRREALSSLNQRSNVDELKTFASAVVQSEHFGTPIRNVLRTQAQQLRVNRRQQAEEKGAKAPVKMMLPMVIFIFPVIFIILLGPTIINFLNR